MIGFFSSFFFGFVSLLRLDHIHMLNRLIHTAPVKSLDRIEYLDPAQPFDLSCISSLDCRNQYGRFDFLLSLHLYGLKILAQ